ncbi:hypothetical protein MMOR_00590 [Mycolicibacterium moriokaense]|uniref:Uncharacterized protein n=1 Tax=Mycolicibacterium moriokaense TaxID=39691 RepID=A0AAD1H883_9MYCO|nr:hypothetical protein MMOR_00590 [Mycolicibacterium moriokaense]
MTRKTAKRQASGRQAIVCGTCARVTRAEQNRDTMDGVGARAENQTPPWNHSAPELSPTPVRMLQISLAQYWTTHE